MTIELHLASNQLKISERKPPIFPSALTISNSGDYDLELIQIWANNARDWNIYTTEKFNRFWDTRISEVHGQRSQKK
jgi:hypothetical protein